MNVKKRARLELPTSVTATVANSASTATDLFDAGMTSSYGSIGTTNGLFLTSNVNGVDVNAGAQIFLTICGDENSNESQEYYAIESSALATHIKQEPDLDLHALIPTNLQLPTGCEIYLVKDTTISTTSPQTATAKSCHGSEQQQQQQQQQILQKHSLASIKLEPDSLVDNCNVGKLTPSTNVLYVGGGSGPCTVSPPTHNIVVAPAAGAGTANCEDKPSVPTTTASSLNVKLDTYQKRDDKRRATHNEVERRRRDKINCWIFKLKEMLPTDGNRYKATTNTDAADANTKVPTKTNQMNGRTPPNDSKSQILIKACEYIKNMQNEIDSLRECLKDAEGLRSSNQSLREELETLKQQHELQERFNSTGGSFNVTLNSLNTSATSSDLFEGIDTAPNLAAVSSINFTKRGLMIADCYDE